MNVCFNSCLWPLEAAAVPVTARETIDQPPTARETNEVPVMGQEKGRTLPGDKRKEREERESTVEE